jgi:hypothetical protein
MASRWCRWERWGRDQAGAAKLQLRFTNATNGKGIYASLLASSKQLPNMRTLYIRNVPDEVAARLEKLAAAAGMPLSTFALQELTESARRAGNSDLLNALPSLAIEHEALLEALHESRNER